MNFGKQLRAEREKQNLSALALANASGASRSYITLIENGKRMPGKKTLPKIADALHLGLATVLNWYLEDVSHQITGSMETSKVNGK